MATRRQRERLALEVLVNAWLQENTGKWWRIPDIANAVGYACAPVNAVLISMRDKRMIEHDDRLVKKPNGRWVPVYKMLSFQASAIGPAWFSPTPPQFTPEQIKGMKTVLGLTGDRGLKKVLQRIEDGKQ